MFTGSARTAADERSMLVCVFTYNRPQLLTNLLRSIDEFFPWGDRVIVDDASDDPGVTECRRAVEGRSGWEWITAGTPGVRRRSGYYSNMKLALSLSLERGYRYCFFVEDDEQFVWRKEDYAESIDRCFANAPDAVQLQPLFFRRIQSYARGTETGTPALEFVPAAGAYRSDRGFTTTGIWNLDVVRRHPDYRLIDANAGSNLNVNSGYWLSKGYRIYLQLDPTVAVVPWIPSQLGHRGSGQTGFTPGRDGYLLQSLSKGEIDFVRSHDTSHLPYQEYFNLSPENSRRPIWHRQGSLLGRYRKLCRQAMETDRSAGHSPAPIRTAGDGDGDGDVGPVLPLPSHLAAYRRLVEGAKPSGMPHSTEPGIVKRIVRKTVPVAAREMVSRFVPADYLGYLRLTSQLRAERRALPFAHRDR